MGTPSRRTTARRVAAAVCATAAIATGMTLTAGSSSAATQYRNCTALHQDYPHGVGLPNAVDSTSGRPVTTFERNADLYNANDRSDRDGDGIACEKR